MLRGREELSIRRALRSCRSGEEKLCVGSIQHCRGQGSDGAFVGSCFISRSPEDRSWRSKTQLLIANRLGYRHDATIDALLKRATQVSCLLAGLIRALKAKRPATTSG